MELLGNCLKFTVAGAPQFCFAIVWRSTGMIRSGDLVGTAASVVERELARQFCDDIMTLEGPRMVRCALSLDLFCLSPCARSLSI